MNVELTTSHSSFIALFFFRFFIGGVDKALGTPGQNRFADRQSFLSLHSGFGLPGGFALVTLRFRGFLLRDCHDFRPRSLLVNFPILRYFLTPSEWRLDRSFEKTPCFLVLVYC